MDDHEDVAELEEILKYKFNNKSLLEEAITHSSMNVTKSYERLELLGDSILSYLVTKHLYWRYPDLDEGTLTSLRSSTVDNENFARVCVKHKFHQFLRMKQQPQLQRKIEKFVKAVEDESESKSFSSGDYNYPDVLADIVESIAGAVLVDSGHSVDKVWGVFMPLLEPLVTQETLQQHPVSELQELCQKHRKRIEYRYSEKGNKVRVEVLIDGKVIAIRKDQKKELVQKAAAKHAVNELKEMLKEEDRVKKAREEEMLKEQDRVKKARVEEMLKEQDRVKKAREEEKHSTGHLNNICSQNRWPFPFYRLVQEDRSPTKRFICAVSVCTENGQTEEYVGNPMPRKKDAKNSAAKAILDDFTYNVYTK